MTAYKGRLSQGPRMDRLSCCTARPQCACARDACVLSLVFRTVPTETASPRVCVCVTQASCLANETAKQTPSLILCTTGQAKQAWKLRCALRHTQSLFPLCDFSIPPQNPHLFTVLRCMLHARKFVDRMAFLWAMYGVVLGSADMMARNVCPV